MENKLNGVEEIAKERYKQKMKHRQFIEDDVELNPDNQLSTAARYLSDPELHLNELHVIARCRPVNWNEDRWLKMATKQYKDRLIIAGALIAAEIDRLNYINQ